MKPMTMRTLIQHFLPALLCASTITALAPAVCSQTIATGEITGTVTDPAGKVILGATVHLKSSDTGETRAVQSNLSGVYRFVFVRPGAYEIAGISEGLKSDTGSLLAAVGQVQILDLHLKLEEPKTVVFVTDAAPVLNKDNADFVYTISTRQLDVLPLPGGDLTGVAYSVPGVVINNNVRFGATGNFVLQGIGSVSNLFTVNGADDMDPYTNLNNSGTTGMLLGANEIREASVIQNAFEGQYGRQAGAQVNYVTKSGTNSYHGNLMYSYNGTQLNANDFFANATGIPRALAISNQYAASFGGPIVRNKLFFFADTEGLRFAVPVPNQVAAVPSPALQGYALKTIQASQVPFYQAMFDLYNAAPGVGRSIPVVTGSGPLQDRSGKLGCGRLAGTPTGDGRTFGITASCAQAWETNASTLISEWLLSVRMDYNLTANQRMFFRFKTDHGFLPVNFNYVSPLFNVFSRQPDYEGQMNHTFLITPRFVNHFIGSVSYNDYVSEVPDLKAAIQALPVQIVIRDGGANGGSIAPVGAPAMYPMGRRAGQFQAVDDISYSRGGHVFKAGVNYRYNPESDLGYAAFVDVGKFTLFRLDDFASGVLTASRYAQNFTVNPVHHLRLYNVGIYIQDQWAPTPNLKVTATVRFDRSGNPLCTDHCFARLADPFPDLGKGLSIPYNQSIRAGEANAFYGVESIVAQPRLSLAYSPRWSSTTVFRGGLGLFSDLYPASFAGQLGINPPNTFFPSIQTGSINSGGPGSAPAIAAASANAFERGFASGATLEQLQQAVAPAPYGPPDYTSLPSTVRSPKFLQWSLEIQHQFSVHEVLALRYMGNRGYDIFVINPNSNANADPAFYPNGFLGLPTSRPDARFSRVWQYTNNGYANYHSLMMSFRHAFGRGFQGQISYVWSHALDTVSNGGLLMYSYTSMSGQIDQANLRSLNYSNADYDVRHNLSGDFIWEGPFKLRNRFMNAVLGKWSAGGKLSAHSGTPFSVINNAVYPSASFGGVALAEVLDPGIRTVCGRSAIDFPCFTGSQFTPAATQASLGNVPRNSFRGPGFLNVDSSLWKTVALGDRVRMVFGASAYNLLNHPNFVVPNADTASPGLGLITSTTVNPSGPYGWYGGPSGRALVVTGKLAF